MNDKSIEIGEFLKNLRRNKHITASEVGKNIDYSQGYISAIENGLKKLPSDKFFEQYLNAISDSKTEYKKYTEMLYGVSNHSIDLRDDSIEDDFQIEFNSNTKNDIVWFEANGDIKTNYFTFPVNDLNYHLNDNHNIKYFNNFELNEHDRIYISNVINSYLETKYRNMVNEKFKDREKYLKLIKDVQNGKELDINHLELESLAEITALQNEIASNVVNNNK